MILAVCADDPDLCAQMIPCLMLLVNQTVYQKRESPLPLSAAAEALVIHARLTTQQNEEMFLQELKRQRGSIDCSERAHFHFWYGLQ